MKNKILKKLILQFLLLAIVCPLIFSQDIKENPALDRKVQAFLEEKKHSWYNMNVPAIDGQLLYDIIVENGYTRALEIGTSTGHSAIWMAWALSKTGGKLLTIEIDEGRYREAMQNFREAGLSEYIDARLADAHRLVKELEGPFDFVFSDADKNWYKNYFIDIEPKLIVGGCFTAHNVSQRRSRYAYGQGEFLEYVQGLDNYETTVNTVGSGVSVSYKKSK